MVRVSAIVLKHLGLLMQPYLRPKEQWYPTLDRLISDHFRQYKSLGPSERRDIYNNSYDLVRYHHLLTHLCKGSIDLEYRLNLLHDSGFYTHMENQKLPKHIRCSFPKLLYDKIEQSLPLDYEAFDFCKLMNTRAPLTLRSNPLKIKRSELINKLSSHLKMEVQPSEVSPYGIYVPSNKNVDLYNSQMFKNGMFEVQDEGSQLAAFQVKCRPGDLVLDYCSGSGGKSLAIGHLLEGKGQIFLHDPREKALENAKKRFHKAGIQNVQFHSKQQTLEKTLKNKVDWVILDVPCSGTGTIRRNPDIKLRFTQKSLRNYLLQQEQILVKATRYLSRNGKIVYMTCSVLKEENEDQIKNFVKTHGFEVVNNEVLRTKTEKNGMDGLFAAVLRRKA